MGEEAAIQKPLLEQIFDAMFAIIEEREEFDTPTIQQLKQLAISGGFTKATRVAEAVKSVQEAAL